MTTPADSTVDLEKAGQVKFDAQHVSTGDHSPASGAKPSHSHHHNGHRVRQRLHQFLHPESGKRIHVASSPEEALRLKRQLESQHEPHEFDVYISGSAEHLMALREAQAHHEDRRETLRSEHGEIYDHFANVHDELNALSMELDRVARHGVSLTAHFDKYGYDARIKTYDDESPHASGAGTPRSSFSGTTRAGEDGSITGAERGFAAPLKLFKPPVVRQYFHKGVLWRSSGAEEVMSFELFVDLLYVGILQITGDAAVEHPDGYSFVKFVVTFLLSWKIWNDMALIISWFETDDIMQRVSILLLLAALFGQTTNVTEAFEHTWPTLIGFYIAARLGMAIYLLTVAFFVPMMRGIMIFYVVTVVIGVALWIGTIYLEYPTQLALIFIALAWDLFGQTSYILLMVVCERMGSKAKAWFDKMFEFYPAINIEHRTERMNAFVSLIFGYSVVALLFQSTRNGIDAHYGKAAMGLAQAFCFNWLYFEVDGSNLHTHAIRRHKISAMGWHMSHIPFVMGYALGGGGLSRLVLAVDTPDSSLERLTERYQEHAEDHVPSGIRWFYCAGFGTALISLGIISICHVHRNIPGLRLRKCWRLCGRFVVGIVLVLLPLAHGLNSTQLVGTVTGLIVLVLTLELWADSSTEDSLFGSCKKTRKRYWGHCPKRQLQAYIKEGKALEHEALANQRLKESGFAMAPT